MNYQYEKLLDELLKPTHSISINRKSDGSLSGFLMDNRYGIKGRKLIVKATGKTLIEVLKGLNEPR